MTRKSTASSSTFAAAALPATAGAPAKPYGRAWLITFTDLVALMLTFFVLLYSMSQIEQPRWQNLVDAFSRRLDNAHAIKIALPVAELEVEPAERIPATELGYLDLILREKLQSEDRLSAAVMWRQLDRIVISLPASVLFEPTSGELSETAKGIVFVLGGVLQQIDNRVEVAAYVLSASDGDPSAAWQLSLGRALAVADMLNRAGYGAGVVARGHGSAGRLPTDLSLSRRASLEERVDFVVFADRPL